MADTPAVLSFDVVGTLIDFETGMLNYLRRACRDELATIDDDTFLAAYRTSRKNPAVIKYPDDLVRVYFELAPRFGLPQDSAIAEGFRASVKDWPAFSDSVVALKRLKSRCKLVAMTNAQRWALDQFALTLGEPFDDSITVDETGCEKPDPSFFTFTLQRLGRDGHGLHDVMHVAQSQYHDIGVARQLGYTVSWIERRAGKADSGGTIDAALTQPDYRFTSLAGLADAFDAGEIRMK